MGDAHRGRRAARWLALEHRDFAVAVDVRCADHRQDLPQLVDTVLRKPVCHMLELEVTESLALHSVATTLAILHDCKRGMKLAMDNFGTGYSSLSSYERYRWMR